MAIFKKRWSATKPIISLSLFKCSWQYHSCWRNYDVKWDVMNLVKQMLCMVNDTVISLTELTCWRNSYPDKATLFLSTNILRSSSRTEWAVRNIYFLLCRFIFTGLVFISNRVSVLDEKGTTDPSRAHECTPGFLVGVCVAHLLRFLCCNFVCLSYPCVFCAQYCQSLWIIHCCLSHSIFSIVYLIKGCC